MQSDIECHFQSQLRTIGDISYSSVANFTVSLFFFCVLANISGNWTSIQAALDGLRQLGLTMGTEDESEDLEVAVDEEMSATEKAVDDAIKKIQDMLEKTKQQDTGKKLEVNSSILTSCTTLMEVCVYLSSH